MEHLGDAELMGRVKGGDFSAFDVLYQRYEEPLRRFLFSLTWDQDTAEDYVQEVFVRLYRARERYEPSGKMINYLLTIAKNYYLARVRRKEPEVVSLFYENRDGFRPFEGIRASARVEPELHLLEGYRRLAIRRAIVALPEKQKLVFVMSHFQQMTYDQISEVLRIPVGTVKSRMFAAVNTLKTMLEEERR